VYSAPGTLSQISSKNKRLCVPNDTGPRAHCFQIKLVDPLQKRRIVGFGITLTSWEARILRRRSFLAALERRLRVFLRAAKLIGSRRKTDIATWLNFLIRPGKFTVMIKIVERYDVTLVRLRAFAGSQRPFLHASIEGAHRLRDQSRFRSIPYQQPHAKYGLEKRGDETACHIQQFFDPAPRKSGQIKRVSNNGIENRGIIF